VPPPQLDGVDCISKLSRAIKTYVDTLHDDNLIIKDDTSTIRRAIPNLEMGVHAVQQEQERQRHHILLRWISSIDFAAQQSDTISRRQEGTGTWFTDSSVFLTWINGSDQTLFSPGIPGAGKTMITAITVDHLWKHVQNEDVGVAYIYCNYKTQADQTATNLTAVILKQLILECMVTKTSSVIVRLDLFPILHLRIKLYRARGRKR
jgi:hypothetical protein